MREAEVSPSPSTSSKADCTGAGSVPFGPKRAVVWSIVVASKVSVEVFVAHAGLGFDHRDELIVETHPQLQLALLRLSAIISHDDQ